MQDYEVISRTPRVALVGIGSLHHRRLDTDFYDPANVEPILRAEERCPFRFQSLDDLANMIQCYGAYSMTKDVRFEDATIDGVPYIRVGDLAFLTVDLARCARISPEVHERLPKSQCKPGMVLITVSATIGRVAVVPPWPTPINSSQHTVKITCKPSVRPHYLAAVLDSSYGQAQMRREAGGAVQKELYLYNVKTLRVPVPDRCIQDFIGAKVASAETCRARSASEFNEACTTLDALWSWTTVDADIRRATSAKAHLVDYHLYEDRLDPEFYQPKFLVLNDWLASQACWKLSELVATATKGVQPAYEVAGTIPALTVTHVDPFVLDRANATGFVTEAWLLANPRARIEAGEILVTVTGPPLGETVVVEDFHLPAAVNSHVARVRTKDDFPYPHLVAGMLNAPLGRLLTTRFCKGIRQKELYSEDLLRFRFPKIPEAQVPMLDRKFRLACQLAERARNLIQEAKADVEALIEGTLDTKAILSGKLKPPTEEEVLGA